MENSAMNEQKKSHKTIWVLIVLIIVVGVIFMINKAPTTIKGTVEGVDVESNFFELISSEVVEDGDSTEIEIKNYTVNWDENGQYQPHSPEFLAGGEIIEISVVRDSGNFKLKSLKIIQGPPTGDEIQEETISTESIQAQEEFIVTDTKE